MRLPGMILLSPPCAEAALRFLRADAMPWDSQASWCSRNIEPLGAKGEGMAGLIMFYLFAVRLVRVERWSHPMGGYLEIVTHSVDVSAD